MENRLAAPNGSASSEVVVKVTTTPGNDAMEGGSVGRTDRPNRFVDRSAGSSKRGSSFSE